MNEHFQTFTVSLSFVSFFSVFPSQTIEFDDHDAHLSQTCVNYICTVISITHIPESPLHRKSFKHFQKKLTGLLTITSRVQAS